MLFYFMVIFFVTFIHFNRKALLEGNIIPHTEMRSQLLFLISYAFILMVEDGGCVSVGHVCGQLQNYTLLRHITQ
jgi:hypothetical protein